MKVLTVVGARPQIIKASAVTPELLRRGHDESIVHTGQHFDDNMAGTFYRSLGVHPEIDLGISGGTNTEMLGRMLLALEPELEGRRPDLVLVYGDTNSTLAGALAAANRRLPLVHVEAGLRSGNMAMAEERNRIVVDQLSGLLLCPTARAVANLGGEGVRGQIEHVGDVMFDVALQARQRLGLPAKVGPAVAADRFVLLTMHRAENVDDPNRLKRMLEYVIATAAGRRVVFPVHPRTRDALGRSGLATGAIEMTDPADYDEMVGLLASADLVMTDSGGVQKEAYFHGVRCVTLREETEWPETIEAGWNRLWTSSGWTEPRSAIRDYGVGRAGSAAVAAIEKWVQAT